MAKADKYSVWLAREFLKQHVVRWFAEDIFQYDRRTGLFQVRDRQWLAHQVQAFLVQVLGVENVTASGVRAVCDSIRNNNYLPSGLHPPFWIDSRKEANVIVTRNVTLLLDAIPSEGKPRVVPHSPDLFAVSGVPYCYKPKADCPNWLRFVSWMVGGNEEEVRLLQEYCAWVFVARQLKLERLLWLVGPGANGKSTFLRIVRYVIGEKATSAVGIEAFSGGETFRLQPTLYKLANFCNDASVRRKGNVAALNNYVSNDPFTINRKFKEQLTIEPSTVLFFASNPEPLVDDASDAFWRRLLLVHCRQRLSETEMDPRLLHKLRAEASGILNWMLAGIPPLVARGRFDVPESVRSSVAALKLQVNAARMFLAEKVEAGEADSFIPRDQLMAAFRMWCEENGYRENDLSVVRDEMLRAFRVELTRLRRGSPTGKGRERIRGWSGVRWRADEDVPTPRLITEMFRSHQETIKDQQERLEGQQRMIKKMDRYIDKKEAQVARLTEKLSMADGTDAGMTGYEQAGKEGAGQAISSDPVSVSALYGGDNAEVDPDTEALMARLAPDFDEPDDPAGGES
jgi:P4 family phage/plasmid primase-like protien